MAEKARKATRAAVVTVYLAANTTRSLDVFDQEEPPSAAVWGPSARLGAKSAFVEFVDGGAVFCSGSSGPPLPLSARRGTSSLYAATLARPKGRLILCTVLGSTPNRSAILRTPSVRPGVLRAAKIRLRGLALSAGDRAVCLLPWPCEARRARVPGSSIAQTRQTRPSFETALCRRVWSCPSPVDAGRDRPRRHGFRTGSQSDLARLRPRRSTDQAMIRLNSRRAAAL